MPIITSVTEHPIEYYHQFNGDKIEKIVLNEMSRDVAHLIVKEAILDWKFTNEGDFRKYELKGFIIGYDDYIELVRILKSLQIDKHKLERIKDILSQGSTVTK